MLKRNRRASRSTDRMGSRDECKADRQLRRLAEGLASAVGTTGGSSDHGDILGLALFYLVDEQEGRPVRKLYAAISQHLQSCESCAETYESLRAFLHSESAARPKAGQPSPALSFLPRGAFETWRFEKSSALLGEPERFGFRFSPRYIRRMLEPGRAHVAREGSATCTGCLLLQDTLQLGDRAVAVTAILDRPSAGDKIEIRLQLTPPDLVPALLSARLYWGEESYATRLENGRARFPGLLLPDLIHGPTDFRLLLELPVAP